MTRYVAFLRGIGPMNPNMRNENLRGVCERLGYSNVQTVISSGNLIFDTDYADIPGLEARLEAEWLRQLEFESTTIIRTIGQIETLVDLDPFGDKAHSPETYLLATFFKNDLDIHFETPCRPPGHDHWILGATDRELFTVTDTVNGATPDVMKWLEKTFGKEISSRTWLTVQRILKRAAG